MLKEVSDRWSAADSLELYEIPRWGRGYFSVSESGDLRVHPEADAECWIELPQIVNRLRERGLDLPILLRFNGILRHRLEEIRGAFLEAIADCQYDGTYQCVFPIKVNQQRHVVERILEYGQEFGFGLEAGSKPELLAAVAMSPPETPIICNGFKDSEFIEMVMLAQKMGRQIIPVVEKSTELDLILAHAERIGVTPQLGMRIKLAARGAGRWQDSGGYRSKFGLTMSELLEAVEELERRGLGDSLQLLHFHLGSQVTSIRPIKQALTEAARVYSDLVKRGLPIRYLDVGGGLGVDYDGSNSNFASSMNYSLQEYANDVVYHVQAVCEDAGVPHPCLMSESGRAVAAYHSVLIFEVLGVSQQDRAVEVPESIPAECDQAIRLLHETYSELNVRNLLESFHDVQAAFDTCMHLFAAGHLSLEQRSLAEKLLWANYRKIRSLVDGLEYPPEELGGLDRLLADTYFCNFSLFQSIPDSWAINQLFPLLPIHRLAEAPRRHAVLGDITCDSDGKIDQFIDCRQLQRTLRLHEFDGTPYYLAAFLVGAYQEILGDLHNLFGDTNAVHVDLLESGEMAVETIIKGDSVREVLEYVNYDGRDLLQRLQKSVETAVRAGRFTNLEAGQFVRFYEQALDGYTYLEKPPEI